MPEAIFGLAAHDYVDVAQRCVPLAVHLELEQIRKRNASAEQFNNSLYWT